MLISKKNFFDIMSKNIGDSCSVLQHTCNHGLVDYSVADSILANGIKIDNSWCIRRTCMPFGVLIELSDEFKKRFFADYNMYSTDECINIVVAVPLFFTDSKGNTYFGGAIKCNHEGVSNDDVTTYIELEMQQRKIVPKEFILGYYKNVNGAEAIDFVFNPDFYAFLPQDKKDKFIKDFNIDQFFNLNGDLGEQIRLIDFHTKLFKEDDKKNLKNYLTQIRSIILQCYYSKDIQIDMAQIEKQGIK